MWLGNLLEDHRRMAKGEAKAPAALGFLTVLDHPQHGLMGGYLVLNGSGRPLEFHCTAAVKPNRAQQILYGPTLAPFLYGEQIGQALVGKSQLAPLLICTDVQPAMAVRPLVPMPVALVLGGEAESAVESHVANGGATFRVDAPHRGIATLCQFHVGRNRLAVAADREGDRAMIQERLAAIGELIDLAEPFGRIREAIEEAQRGGRSPSASESVKLPPSDR